MGESINKFVRTTGGPSAGKAKPRQVIEEVLSVEEYEFKPRPERQTSSGSVSPARGQQAGSGQANPQRQGQGASQVQREAPQRVVDGSASSGLVKPDSELDPAYTMVDLPSDGKLYKADGFDKLSVRHLLASHQAKFARAAKEKSIRHVVDAISGTIGGGVSAYRLTPTDFYWLMYWQRVNSYAKTPYLIRSTCDGHKHNADVQHKLEEADRLEAADDPVDPKVIADLRAYANTLQIEEVMSQTTFKERILEWPKLQAIMMQPEMQDFLQQYPLLDVERMHSVVEAQELFSSSDKSVLEELKWHCSYAAFFDYLTEDPSKPRTLKERCDLVAKMPPDDIELFDQYIEAVTDYGVSNLATLRCRECGEAKTVELQIDATTFLPGTYGRVAFR